MSQDRPYDAWLQWVITNVCNQRCHYCINVKMKQEHASQTARPVDISTLIRVLDKTGKRLLIGITGGEPFLVPNIIDVCKALTEKHVLSINTNLTLHRVVEKFADEIDPQKVVFMIASVHVEQLDKYGIFHRFVDSFSLLQKRGFNMYAHRVAYPESVERELHIKERLRENGIDLCFTPYVGEYRGQDYPRAYSEEECSTFGIDSKSCDHYYPYHKMCNAGYNIVTAYPDGNVHPCHGINSSLGNLSNEIHFADEMTVCPLEKCSCPFFAFDIPLYEQAREETSGLTGRLLRYFLKKRRAVYNLTEKFGGLGRN